MKKTIAAILVTILASAGYIVLDKAAVEKIDTLASQVSSQQVVIDNYIAPANPLEMHTGSTLRCYPAEGETVQAYVLDRSLTTTWSPITTTKPAGPTIPTKPEMSTAFSVHANGIEPTAPTVVNPPNSTTMYTEEPTVPYATTSATTESPTSTTTLPEPTMTTASPTVLSPDGYYYSNREYYYHLRTDVQITRFRCEMIGKTLTGVPKFSVSFSGKVDPSFAGRQIVVRFDDSQVGIDRETAMIQSDGSFSVSAEFALANTAVVPLYLIRID